MPALSIKKENEVENLFAIFRMHLHPSMAIDKNDWHATNNQEFKGEVNKGPQYPFLSLHQHFDHNQVKPAQVFKIEFKRQNNFKEKFYENVQIY